MRVMFVIDRLDRGGSEHQLLQAARGLRDAGHEVVIVIVRAGGVLDSSAKNVADSVVNVPKLGRLPLVLVLTLRRLLHSCRPDATISFLPIDNLRLARVRLLTRQSRFVWGMRFANLVYPRIHVKASMALGLQAQLSGLADLIIANSQAGARELESRGYDMKKVTVVPNGIDLERFRIDRDAGKVVALSHGLDPARPIIGMIARFDHQKGQDLFARIAHDLLMFDPGLQFVIFGRYSDEQRRDFDKISRSLGLDGVIKLAGESNDPPAAINCLTVLVVPSRSEGFPNVVVEGLACGVPVVASDVGDSALILNGIVETFSPGDTASAAQIVRSLLSERVLDPQTLRESVSSRFDRLTTDHRFESELLRMVADH